MNIVSKIVLWEDASQSARNAKLIGLAQSSRSTQDQLISRTKSLYDNIAQTKLSLFRQKAAGNITSKTEKNWNLSLRKKCSYSELFWSTFFLHFSAFGLNTERYSVSLRIQSDWGEMREKCQWGYFPIRAVFTQWMKDDCRLFSSLCIACQTRGGDFDNFFSHENHSFPV